MTAQPLATPFAYFTDNNGAPLAGGLVYTYAAGTNTPQASYTDSSGVTPNANPVVLDSAGRAAIWLSGFYKIIVKDSLGNTIGVPADNVTAINSSGNMNTSVYDPANIAEQLVGLTAVQTLLNKSATTVAVGTNTTQIATAALLYASLKGALFNTQQGQLTTPFTTTSVGIFVTITGLTINITPTLATSTVLVRAVIQVSNSSTSTGLFQLLRGSTPIGVATSPGTRSAAGASTTVNSVNIMQTITLEWLDNPATTSVTTYAVQCCSASGTSGTIAINSSVTDTNSSTFPRTASTITVHEVHP